MMPCFRNINSLFPDTLSKGVKKLTLLSLTLETAVWITMKDRKNMKKKTLNCSMLPFKSFSNFMVKEQVLFSLS